MRRFLFIGLFLTVCASKAQILQVDHRQFAEDTIKGWVADLGTDFQYNNLGDVQTEDQNYLSLTLTGNLSFFTEKDHYFLKNSFWYSQVGNDLLVSQGYSHFRVDLNYKNRFSPEFFAQVQYDDSRKIDLRLVSGLGYRYIFLRNEKTELEYGLGAILEHEKWDNLATAEENDQLVRTLPKLASYFGFYRNFKHVKLSLMQFYQTGYDGTSEEWRNRISGNFVIDDNITKNLELIIRFNYEYDFNPVIPIKKFFFTISNGLKIKF